MSVTIGGDHLKHAVVNGEQGNIKGTTTKIEHKDVLLAFFLVQTIGDGSSRPGNITGPFNTCAECI